MSELQDFNYLVERAMSVSGRSHMRPAIVKELFHYDILFALDESGLLDGLTFQGGTSLRLCYGAPRFSEDLDFVGGKDFSTQRLHNMKNCLEEYIGKRYQLEIHVKEPKELHETGKYHGIKVDKWQIGIVTSPEKKDLPKQKIKVEVVNIPAYSRIPRALQNNYDFLPDGYSDMLIMTESENEILSDKLIALVSCQRYIRNRDIWDLRWLKQQGATVNPEYIIAKIQDYQISDYADKLNLMIENLPDIVRGKNFRDEMSRFIPIDVQERTLAKDKFIDFLIEEDRSLLLKVKDIVSS